MDKATNGVQNLLRTLPLHSSQKEIETMDNGAVLSIFAQPNTDLRRELLSHGADITVMAPMWLRKELHETAHKMARNHNGTPIDLPTPDLPSALTEQDLMHLCEEYRYEIGSGTPTNLRQKIRIRYVIDRDRFGYANFGDFFFIETGDLYYAFDFTPHES